MRTAIVLAGGSSSRLGCDKGLRMVAGKPLVSYAVDALLPLVEEVIMVVGSEAQRAPYEASLPAPVKVLVDRYPGGSPLIGLITGLQTAEGEYAFVTACDMPFISQAPVEFLFHRANGRNGAVFIKPNGWIEPLMAVYRVAGCLPEATRLFRANDLRIRMVLRNLRDVEYVPLSGLDFETELLFYDTDTEEKISFAERVIKEKRVP